MNNHYDLIEVLIYGVKDMKNEKLTQYLFKGLFPCGCGQCASCDKRMEEVTDILIKENITDTYFKGILLYYLLWIYNHFLLNTDALFCYR